VKYGPGSEKLSNLQLQLFEEEPGISNQGAQTKSESGTSQAPDDEKKRQRRAHPAGQTLPADLPRVEKVVACAAKVTEPAVTWGRRKEVAMPTAVADDARAANGIRNHRIKWGEYACFCGE
jgi:hypothetical protein